MAEKSNEQDRNRVIKEIERINETTLKQVGSYRKYLYDDNGRFYIIVVGTDNWHGIQVSMLDQKQNLNEKNSLVVVKKTKEKMDIYTCPLYSLIKNKDKLSIANSNSGKCYQFSYDEIKDALGSDSLEIKNLGLKLTKFSEIKHQYDNNIEDKEETIRTIREQSIIKRNPKLVKDIKQLYGYKCQICDTAIELWEGLLYAEAHHVKPLGSPHDGPDNLSNMLCVCPNHHVQLDLGAIKLDKSKLRFDNDHSFCDEYIEYHNNKIFK